MINILIYILIIFGSGYRYLRTISGFHSLNIFPYILILIILLLILKNIISKGVISNLFKEFLFSIYLMTMVGVLNSLIFGFYSQTQYFSDLILPAYIVYYVGINGEFMKKYINNILIIFLIISLLFTSIEFYSTNFLFINFFNFSEFWATVNQNSFHSSVTYYLFLGNLVRPWGILAMPQASGSVFAFLAVYFLIIIKDKKINFLYFFLSLTGIYISGSRTALFSLIFGMILIAKFNNYLNLYKKKDKSILFFIVIIGTLIGLFYTIINQDFGNSKSHFINDFINKVFFYYLNPNNIIFVLFGTGDNPNMAFSEFGLINNLMRIGIINILLIAQFFIRLINRYNKISNSFYYKKKSIVFFILTITFLFAGLHYNIIRYPTNLLLAIWLGIIINNLRTPNFQYSQSKN